MKEYSNLNDLLSVHEKLSDYAHETWSGWMKYMFSKMTMNEDGTATMPKWAVDRWSRQMNTKYSDMPESEKESDRAEADHILSIIKANKKMKKYSKQERDKFLTDALTGEDVETRQDKIRTDLHKEILRDEDQDPSASN